MVRNSSGGRRNSDRSSNLDAYLQSSSGRSVSFQPNATGPGSVAGRSRGASALHNKYSASGDASVASSLGEQTILGRRRAGRNRRLSNGSPSQMNGGGGGHAGLSTIVLTLLKVLAFSLVSLWSTSSSTSRYVSTDLRNSNGFDAQHQLAIDNGDSAKRFHRPAGFGLNYGQKRVGHRIVAKEKATNLRNAIGQYDGLFGDDDQIAVAPDTNVIDAHGMNLGAIRYGKPNAMKDYEKNAAPLPRVDNESPQNPQNMESEVPPLEQIEVESEATPLQQIEEVGVQPPPPIAIPVEPPSYREPSDAIAYVLPVLRCPDDPNFIASLAPYDARKYTNETKSDKAFRDAAAVLQHSIARVHGAVDQTGSDRYSFQMYAIVHPEAVQCVDSSTGLVTNRYDILTALGYRVLVREEPVLLQDFGSSNPNRRMVERYQVDVERNTGGDGYRDFIRLHAFAVTWHPLVVMVDLETMFLRPIEEVYDAILAISDGSTVELAKSSQIRDIGSNTQLLYQRDYNAVTNMNSNTGYETSLLVIRPSQQVFDDLVQLLLSGGFDSKSGWGSRVGTGYSHARISSGLLTYYFEHVRQNDGAAVELNRCVYGNKNDGPYIKLPKKGEVCRDGIDGCEDCRMRPFEDIRVSILKVCQSPWTCFFHQQKVETIKHCRWFHGAWFRLRKEVEEVRAAEFPTVPATGNFWPQHFQGYCSRQGLKGYTPMGLPDNAQQDIAAMSLA